MQRFQRHTLVLVPAILSVLVFGFAGVSNAALVGTSLLGTRLSCSDGTNLNLTLSPAQLIQLTNAVTAMTLYPAGLSCVLSPLGLSPLGVSSGRTSTAALSFSGSQPDLAVGGGQASNLAGCGPGVATNFGLSAHVASNTQTQGVGGSFVVTVPDNVGGCHAQLMSTIDCLQVNGNSANLTARVTGASGNLAFLQGQEIAVAVLDSSNLSTPDMIDDFLTGGPCQFTGAADRAVTNGNITVIDAQ
jgi:hypothetical protein